MLLFALNPVGYPHRVDMLKNLLNKGLLIGAMALCPALNGVAHAQLGTSAQLPQLALTSAQVDGPPIIQPINDYPIQKPNPAQFMPYQEAPIAQPQAQLNIRKTNEIQPQPQNQDTKDTQKSLINLNLSPKNTLTGWGSAILGGPKDMGVGIGVSIPLGKINTLELSGRSRLELLGSNPQRKNSVNIALDTIIAFQIAQFDVYAGPSMDMHFGQGFSLGALIGMGNTVTNQWGWFAEGHFRTKMNDSGLSGVNPSARFGLTLQLSDLDEMQTVSTPTSNP